MKEVLESCTVCGRPTRVRITSEGLSVTVNCACDCDDIRQAEMKRHIEPTNRETPFTNILKDSRYQEYVFDRDDQRERKVSDRCREYVTEFPEKLTAKYRDHKKIAKGLILAGTTGNGKSFYAGCIGNALTAQGYKVLMTTLPKLAADLGFTDYADRLNSLKAYDLLILDDWGVERKTEYMDEIVQTVIDERYRQALPIVITTNRSIKEIVYPKDQTDRRIISRLCEMAEVIPVKGQDRRMENLA